MKKLYLRVKSETMNSIKHSSGYFFALLIIFILNSLVGLGQGIHHTCGFEPTAEDLDYMYNHVMKQSPLPRAKSDGLICLPVQAYVVRTSAGTGGPNPTGWSTAMANMNYFYKDAGVSFFWKSPPIYVDNSSYYDFVNGGATTEDGLVNLFNPPLDAINFYFVNSINGPGTAGYAYYPGNTAVTNRLVMRHDALSQVNNKTVLHELGHYFSVLHTFSGNNNPLIENVTRSGPNANCYEAGDTFCDTEADPGFMAGEFNLPLCQYTGNGTDMFGESYTPPVRNFMAYFPSQCADEFTPEQYARLAQGVATRLGHTAYSLDATPMIVAAPTNLTADVINDIVTLNWTDNADNEMGYIVELSQESATTGFQALPNKGTAADITTINWTGFDENEVYWFRVKATNASCNSFSNVVFLGGGINLDFDNSSQAGNFDYHGEDLCAPGETFITDDDVRILGSAVDAVIKIRLINRPNGAKEFLQSPSVEGITVVGNGTGNLTLTNSGGLSKAEFENFLSEIKYMHTGENVIAGLRTIEFFRISQGVDSPVSHARIQVGQGAEAGIGGPFTICPEGQTFWANLTPPNASEGGKWYNGANTELQGSVNSETLPGTFTYRVGADFCQKESTYLVSIVESPLFETASGRPYCETQCNGFIEASTSTGFQLYVNGDNLPASGRIDGLCDGSFTLTTTNGTGCHKSKDFNLNFEYVNNLTGMPAIICTSEPTRFSDYITLSKNASLILNDMSVGTHTAMDLNNNQMYTLAIYDNENCIDRSIEFRTELCPTKNTDVIFIPNAFSPNEDGVNDIFKVVSQYELEFYEMQIFDRYGARVFASTNPDEGWNGSHGGGNYYLPPGICNYHLRYKLPNDIETRTVFGTIQIVR